jgi:hypothetical protein
MAILLLTKKENHMLADTATNVHSKGNRGSGFTLSGLGDIQVTNRLYDKYTSKT